MYQAPRSDQLALLDIVELDAQLTRLRRADETHPLRAQIGQLMNTIAALGRDIMETESSLSHIQEALDEASSATEKFRAVVVDKETRLNAGVGMDSRQLLTLQSEIETNHNQLAELEQAEYAELEKLDNAEERIADAQAQQKILNAQLVENRAQLEDDIAVIARDIHDLQLRRESLYRPINDALKHAYERAQETGGLTVIALRPDGTTSGGVGLSPIDVAQIRQAEPDHFHISEDYDCIIIRDRDFPLE
ncbi:zinc ribbon domain-containing protein [Arcanobacterium buesumense]|uniref:CT398-like coiled coil hairpin domain-containing protein n=1 Tax=Arcanobacterium buesumense TaxID=2722751 RepID=A0A6H2ELB4_9ACTO|nr:hypothetical protein [Arcanobacterium buesumense]QJC21652.1 hypothetical protein HC352_03460 [Arcanobacterium buesumense]